MLTLLTFDRGKRANNECVFASSLILQTSFPIGLIVAGLLSIAVVVVFELRKTAEQEAEMITGEDPATSKSATSPLKWRDAQQFTSRS